MRQTFLFAHLIGFGLGFGAVMCVDIVGALWLFGYVPARRLIWLTGVVQKIIWTAVLLLILSGIYLLPHYISARTLLKLGAVIILVINGFVLDQIRRRLLTYKQDDFWKLPHKFQLVSVISISISQLMWWTAIVIGFLNASSHY